VARDNRDRLAAAPLYDRADGRQHPPPRFRSSDESTAVSDPFARAVALHRRRAFEGVPAAADEADAASGGELIRVDFQPVPDGDSAIEA